MSITLQRDTRELLAGLMLVAAALVALLFVMGSLNLRLPEVHAADKARTALSWAAGLSIVAAGILLIVLAVPRLSPASAVTGSVLALVGLYLVGVTIGLPEPFEALLELMTLLIRALNALIRLLAVRP